MKGYSFLGEFTSDHSRMEIGLNHPGNNSIIASGGFTPAHREWQLLFLGKCQELAQLWGKLIFDIA